MQQEPVAKEAGLWGGKGPEGGGAAVDPAGAEPQRRAWARAFILFQFALIFSGLQVLFSDESWAQIMCRLLPQL